MTRARHLGGWRRDRPDTRDVLLPRAAGPIHLPSSVLLPLDIPVLDQGQEGSCVAHAVVEAVMYLDLRDDGHMRDWSRQFLYAVTRLLEGTPLAEDSGCEIRDAMKALRARGVCLETTWPYSNGYAVTPSAAAYAEALLHVAQFYYRCATVRAIKAALAHGLPVAVGFTVFPSMMDSKLVARTGEVPLPEQGETAEGGHAILLYGFDDNQPIDGPARPVGAFRFRNSWGGDWGKGGDGFLPYAYFERALASDAWALSRVSL